MGKTKRILRSRHKKIIQCSASDGIVQNLINEYKTSISISSNAPRRRRTIRKVIRRAKRQYGAKLSHELPETAPSYDISNPKYKQIDFYYKGLELIGKVVNTRVFPEPFIFLYPSTESAEQRRLFANEENRRLNNFITFCINVGSGKVVAQVLLAWPHGNHSNAILLDLDRKQMFWFEPEGYHAFEDLEMKTAEEKLQHEHHQQVSMRILAGLQRFYPSFEMAPMNISCPLVGPQGREENISPGRGNCGIWSMMFMHYCLLNPIWSIFDINALMVYSFEPSILFDRITTYKQFLIEYYESGAVNPDFQTFPVQQGFEITRERCQNFINDIREKNKLPRNPVTGNPQKMLPTDIRALRTICESRFGM